MNRRRELITSILHEKALLLKGKTKDDIVKIPDTNTYERSVNVLVGFQGGGKSTYATDEALLITARDNGYNDAS
jgi:hypothetical protein